MREARLREVLLHTLTEGGHAADVVERRPQSLTVPGAIDAAIKAERARTAKLVAEKMKQSQAGLAEAIDQRRRNLLLDVDQLAGSILFSAAGDDGGRNG